MYSLKYTGVPGVFLKSHHVGIVDVPSPEVNAAFYDVLALLELGLASWCPWSSQLSTPVGTTTPSGHALEHPQEDSDRETWKVLFAHTRAGKTSNSTVSVQPKSE